MLAKRDRNAKVHAFSINYLPIWQAAAVNWETCSTICIDWTIDVCERRTSIAHGPDSVLLTAFKGTAIQRIHYEWVKKCVFVLMILGNVWLGKKQLPEEAWAECASIQMNIRTTRLSRVTACLYTTMGLEQVAKIIVAFCSALHILSAFARLPFSAHATIHNNKIWTMRIVVLVDTGFFIYRKNILPLSLSNVNVYWILICVFWVRLCASFVDSETSNKKRAIALADLTWLHNIHVSSD